MGKDPMKHLVIVDFDGTLADYKAGWQGADQTGAPIVDVAGISAPTFIRMLQERGFDVAVHSCRGDTATIGRWLLRHGLEVRVIDDVGEHNATMGYAESGHCKPVAHAYVDDRAVRFDGDYRAVLRVLERTRWENAIGSLEPCGGFQRLVDQRVIVATKAHPVDQPRAALWALTAGPDPAAIEIIEFCPVCGTPLHLLRPREDWQGQ